MKLITFVNTDQVDETSLEALDFAKHAQALGHEIVLVGLIWDSLMPPMTPLGREADGRKIPFRVLQKRFLFDPGFLGQARAMFQKIQPDLFQSYGLSGIMMGRVARKFQIPWQAIAFESDYESEANGWAWSMKKRCSRRWLRKANQIIIDKEIEFLAQSKHLHHQCVVVFPGRQTWKSGYKTEGTFSERARSIMNFAERIVQEANAES